MYEKGICVKLVVRRKFKSPDIYPAIELTTSKPIYFELEIRKPWDTG